MASSISTRFDELMSEFHNSEVRQSKILSDNSNSELDGKSKFSFEIKAPSCYVVRHYWFAFTADYVWLTEHARSYDSIPAYDFYRLDYSPLLGKKVAQIFREHQAYQALLDSKHHQKEERRKDRLMNWAKKNPLEFAYWENSDEFL